LEILGTPGIPELGVQFPGIPGLKEFLPGVEEHALRLRQSSFLRGLTAAMLAEGVPTCEICRLYALHQPGDECPVWGPPGLCPPCPAECIEVGGACVPACLNVCVTDDDCEGVFGNPDCDHGCCGNVIE
jgi:hypothetical protein